MPAMENFGFYKILLIFLVAGYLGLVLFAAIFANRLVFPAPPAGYRDSEDIIKFTRDDKGTHLSMVFLPHPDSSHLVFYHHGNGEDLSHIISRLEAVRHAGFSVLAWDYPGYGTSEGKPTESGIYRAAEQILKSIPDTYGFDMAKVVHYGRSLGGGPGIWLAVRYPCAGVILEGSFTSIFRVALPVNILPWDMFDNLKGIRDIKCPLLVIHGTEDKTVPFSHAKQLYQAALEPKFFTWLDQAGHNDLLGEHRDVYLASLVTFNEYLERK